MKKEFLREKINRRFESCMEELNLERVYVVMSVLDLKWFGVGLPSVGDMKREVKRAYDNIVGDFIDCIEEGVPSERWMEVGGFRVELAYDSPGENTEFDVFIKISFIVEEMESWLSESN